LARRRLRAGYDEIGCNRRKGRLGGKGLNKPWGFFEPSMQLKTSTFSIEYFGKYCDIMCILGRDRLGIY
jgi:hypothetical protein